ncbi:MAG TPA: UDP-N-acetylmuramoyl-L-alanyl-D-glutamate--2,6-diaminopimelate ligase [Polyangiaceae bacterium LLY-WYZ-15_(1-7)]|nr:UDP-N-acetylmuramoyl-L-alanyl-D-glutamate--2,6-diaminopimelate ligase [Polyangiaceae bacterium LLY-WYZ-15_(1-7)]
MRLVELQRRFGGALHGGDVEVKDARRDSRVVQPGDLFAAVPGATVDGARFAPQALEKGAAAVLTERRLELDAPQWVVESARATLGPAAHALHGDPTEELAVVGVTGTNGKTTTTYLIDEALRTLGASSALLGTVAARAGKASSPASFTTPEADDLARFAACAVDAGATHLVMEVSSHGLDQERVGGVRFEVAAFTNLSQDHLDYHGTMEAYGEAKARLFLAHAPAACVFHVDDAFGAALADRAEAAGRRVLRVGRGEAADVRASAVRFDAAGIEAEVATPRGALTLRSRLVGAHNLENLLVALGVLLALQQRPGHETELAEIAAALGAVTGAPGRLERVADPRGVSVLVDYAHTPDALARALDALRPLTTGRLIALFGCGGDRDAAKRPKMGRAAGERADWVVVTSDNPRTEDPAAIVEAILPGVEASGQPRREALGGARGYVVEVDRRAAIRQALAAAEAGDTVLIAGKGHEDYQILGTTKHPFDDRVEAAAAIAALTDGEGA